jgi:hypothetical protein
MKTWPGGLLTCLLVDLPARFSSDNGRAEFIWLFSANNCILQGGGGGLAKLNKTVHSVYTASDSVDWQTGFHDANANGGPHSGTPILFFIVGFPPKIGLF